MTTIEKRIEEHMEFRGRLFNKKRIVEADLENIQDKIMFHSTAIHNLRQKQKKGIC